MFSLFKNFVLKKHTNKLIKFFSTENVIYNDPNDQKKEANIDKDIISLTEYKEAMDSFHNEKYALSEELFKRILNILENSYQAKSDSYIHILKKLIINSNMLRKYQQTENYLEKLIEVSREKKSNEIILYNEYNNLILHCMRTNLNKAILMSKALLSEKEKQNLPVSFQKIFLFNLGTSYLLKGNYVDSKTRLRECLSLGPTPVLKGFALNNLAVASWWHKSPIERSDKEELELESKEYSLSQIDNDFKFVIPLLKNSISNLENVDIKPEGELKENLKLLLNQNDIIPKKQISEILFENKFSKNAIMNIGEFLFLTSPDKKNEAAYWFRYALKFFEKCDPSSIDRCLIFLALFCKSSSQFIKAEGLYRKALDMLDKSDSYNKVLCMNLYGKMLLELPNRNTEGENFIAQSQELASKMPFWSNKITNVSIPDLEL